MQRRYASMAEIKQKFIVEVVKSSGLAAADVATRIGWPLDAAQLNEAAPTPAAEKPLMSTIDCSDPRKIAEQSGFTINSVFFEKSVGGKMLYAVSEFTSDHVVFKLKSIWGDEIVTKKTVYNDLRKFWAPFKGSVPQMAPKASELSFSESKAMAVEYERAGVFQALFQLASNHENTSLQYSLNPPEVHVGKTPFKKNALVLVPATEFSKITQKETPNSIEVHTECGSLWLSAPAKIKSADPKSVGDAITVPFWWVETTCEESEANMVLGRISQNGYSISALKNSKALHENDKLLLYKEKKKAQASPIAPEPPQPANEGAAPPAKRRKAN